MCIPCGPPIFFRNTNYESFKLNINANFRFLRAHKINYIVEEDNALNGPTKQAPWMTFNGVNHGDSQVASVWLWSFSDMSNPLDR